MHILLILAVYWYAICFFTVLELDETYIKHANLFKQFMAALCGFIIIPSKMIATYLGEVPHDL